MGTRVHSLTLLTRSITARIEGRVLAEGWLELVLVEVERVWLEVWPGRRVAHVARLHHHGEAVVAVHCTCTYKTMRKLIFRHENLYRLRCPSYCTSHIFLYMSSSPHFSLSLSLSLSLNIPITTHPMNKCTWLFC